MVVSYLVIGEELAACPGLATRKNAALLLRTPPPGANWTAAARIFSAAGLVRPVAFQPGILDDGNPEGGDIE